MTAALCRKRPSPLASGQRRTWACSIIYVLGQINFLSDKATQPNMTMADVCAAFSVGQRSTYATCRASYRLIRREPGRRHTAFPSLSCQPRHKAEVRACLADGER